MGNDTTRSTKFEETKRMMRETTLVVKSDVEGDLRNGVLNRKVSDESVKNDRGGRSCVQIF